MATLAELFSTAYHSAKENALRQRAQEAQENYWQRLLQQQAEELALRRDLGERQLAQGDRQLSHTIFNDERNFQRWQQEFQAALEQWQQDHELRKKAAETQRLMAGTQADYLNLAWEKHKAEMDLINQQRHLAELIQNFEFMGTQPPYPPMGPEPATKTIGDLYRESGGKHYIGPGTAAGVVMNMIPWQAYAEKDEEYIVDMLNTVTPFEPKTPEELAALRNTRQYAVVHNTLLQIYDYINNNKYFSKEHKKKLKAMAQIKGRRLGFDLESEYNAALNAEQQPTE